MPIRSLAVAFLALPLLAVAAPRATETWSVTTDAFETLNVTKATFDDAGVRGTAPNGTPVEVPIGRIVQMARVAKTESGTGLVLFLTGGDRLVGQPKSFDGSALTWFTVGVGDVKVPIEQAIGIVRDVNGDDRMLADRNDDEARLLNGDVVRGIVASATDRSFGITPTGGVETTIPADSIASLFFAAPPQGRSAAKAAPFRVSLPNGTRLSASRVSLQNEKLVLTLLDGTTTDLTADRVVSIEQTSGPVTWLSNRRPTASEQVPYFGGSFPARMDATVTGEPIRFGGVTYAHGIGVHSRSKLVFNVEPGDARFRTRYAIDPLLGYADVDVRIRLGDKIVHEAKGFKSGVLSPPVEIDLMGAKTLTLEVDYGQGYDVQDRLNWIEPAILRNVQP